MDTMDWLHEKVRRLGDAIFCLEEINSYPEIVGILRKDLTQTREDFEIEKKKYEDFKSKNDAEKAYCKKNIPEKIRWAIWNRDNFTCQNCGSRKRLTIDHIYPESKGGKIEPSNLQTLCKSCNSKKGAR